MQNTRDGRWAQDGALQSGFPSEIGASSSYPAANTAQICLLSAPAAADKEYSYLIPAELRGILRRGCFVHVPFGKGNRAGIGVVVNLSYSPETGRLKPVLGVREEVLSDLSEDQLALCAFLKEHTFCSFGDAVRCMMPPGAVTEIEALYSLPPTTEANMLPLPLYQALRDAKSLKSGAKLAKLAGGTDGEELLRRLAREGILTVTYRLRAGAEAKYREYALLTDPERCAGEKNLLKGEKQKAVLEYLLEHGTTELTLLRQETGAGREQLKALEKKELLRIEREELFRDLSAANRKAPPDKNLLSSEQQAAADRLLALAGEKEAKAALLYGVTGSGKTRVIKAVIDGVLAAGRQVILLVPEISLTPQTVSLFSAFYGDKVAVLHSSLSDGERFDAWRRMKYGSARICVGTRSAVFAPFDNLGLIVIDEEQEHTYKSDQSPRYHAKDVARFRCGKSGALLLLSSATPSIESFYKAKTGVYSLVELKNRYGEAVLPKTFLCDLRGTPFPPGEIPLGELLGEEIEKNMRCHEQTILFVQRRGYHSVLRCRLCGEAVNCPNCSVTMTYHSKGRQDPASRSPEEKGKGGYLTCHYCGYRAPVPGRCSCCGSDDLSFLGFGTQLLESELAKRFPGLRILRMDADTTGSKYAYDRMLSAFRQGEYDLLLGTQMVTKGHDFPGVTLVGVLSADSGLYLGDYRAGEKTFSLLTQVIGRGGRGKSPGRAVIQTYSPDHPILRFAAGQDYAGFYENEIGLRRALDFPPFCDIALLTLSGSDEQNVQSAALLFHKEMDRLLREEFDSLRVVLFGPFEAPIYRLNGKYRMRFVLKCRSNRRTREFLRRSAAALRESVKGKIALTIDMNPSSL